MTRPAGGPAPGIGPSRRLLARLRDVMAGSGTAQSRLDKIVTLIAAEMVAEVCSCYVSRPGDVLELFATIGLNPDAVHRTRLRVGEGLVGEVAATARPLAIANAPAHPKFAYRPETGEDPYESWMGVPILRGGKVRGVLIIQNQHKRNYSEDEVETLETIAMVVAELIVGGEIARPEEVASPTAVSLPARLHGIALNGGLAQGLAVLHRTQITVRQMVADDPAVEAERFRQAVEHMHRSLDDLVADHRAVGIGESGEILETYRMFAEDRGWLSRIHEAIDTGLSAEAAVQRVQNDMAARMARVTDPYLRERLADFDDLANRLLLHLAGRTSAAALGTLPDDMVLVARAIGPAELLDYDRRKLRGLVLEEGSATSHVAIIARALDIPVVGRCVEAMRLIEPLDPIVVDGDHGNVFVRPSEDVMDTITKAIQVQAGQRKIYAEEARLPAVTRDGAAVSLMLNAGLLSDMPHLDAVGADGIGLYRTEIPFMVRSEYPSVATQTDLYSRVIDLAEGRPVVFRTLDVGGDKRLPYFAEIDEDNPALGWRAVRIGLDRPAMLRQQLRALIQGAAGRPFGVMFPMVSEVTELDAARDLFDREVARAAAQGVPVSGEIRVGVMLEVPSLLWQLDQVLRTADFVAVGSNDLMQYLYAADRTNTRVAQRYDTLSPGLIGALAEAVARCDAAGRRISLCGEMASRPIEAMTLLGLGFRTLSMPATAIGAVRTMVRSLDLGHFARWLSQVRANARGSLRPAIRAYARDHDVAI
ncbi:phosphoenolpyruvate--protein phosphotransferase [Inquilinus limosus]|uniref:phosphoenolpyruvate--protein phosphotransferase n=1 Tax=Inquilinus limosus TaxID=171674 RepID=UPI00068B9A19|nr:phosphoenolpyruvate--protein phosphotransferase [Inquilinus limosus]